MLTDAPLLLYNEAMILIQNGRLIDPLLAIDECLDIFIADTTVSLVQKHLTEDDCIAHVKKDLKRKITPGQSLKIIDATGLIVSPGFVDTHVHFRDPGFTEKEDVHTGSLAAAAGGYTSVIMMANTKPPVDSAETLEDLLARAAKEAIHIYACANVTKGMAGKELTDFQALKEAGAKGFTDDGIPIMNETLLKKAMKEAASLHLPISLHEENPAFIRENGIHAGGVAAAHYGLTGADRMAEISMVERDLKLAAETGATLCIQHVSCKETVDLIRKAKKKNPNIHAEGTPHHFSLTEEAVIRHGTLAKVNPPIRTEEDRQAILKGLSDKTLDLIATDHAPHTAGEKQRFFPKAPSGMIGLETALSLAIKALVHEKGLPLMELIRLMSTNPANLYQLPAGTLKQGAVADLVLFHPERERIVPSKFHSKSSNSPYAGMRLPGVIVHTICAGKIVYSEND